MTNMGYCRFQNTVGDLQDCSEHIDDDLSDEEERARRELMEICRFMVSQYDWESHNEADF